MSGWTPALRIARRELLRAKGRTLLVLVMVLLPVAAVACLSTLLRTGDVSTVESLPRELGAAEARLEFSGARVEQDPFLRSSGGYEPLSQPSDAELRAALPAGSRLLEARSSLEEQSVQVGDRRRRVGVVGVDLSDPAVNGPYRLTSGRAPAGDDEVAVTQELADLGVEVGSTIELAAGVRTVTGIALQPYSAWPARAVLGLDDAVGLEPERDGPTGQVRYWVTVPRVTWQDVRGLNDLGFSVLSRAVVEDPPPSDLVPQTGFDDGRAVTAVIVALIATMAVLEVALLAGPAFAVGARRQRRSLALLAATGGEPRHVRQVVLSQGLLVGLVAAVVGVPLGIGIAAVVAAVLRTRDPVFGPFEVSLRDVLLVAVLGAGVALLAALAPAWAVARQPIVAALQGRRVTSAGAGRPALAGLLLIAVGVAITLVALRGSGSTYSSFRELGVAAGAIPTVLGAVLLAPAALALVGRFAGRLPLPLRFATRDADRQRGRTAPAVAAIAATVAGVVALGISSSSDAEQSRRTYDPSGPPGVALVTAYGAPTDWDELADVAAAALPDESVTVLRGVAASGPGEPYEELRFCRVGEPAPQGRCLLQQEQEQVGSFLGAGVLVGAEALDALSPGLQPALRSQAEQVLDQGGVLIAAVAPPGPQVSVTLTRYPMEEGARERVLTDERLAAARLPVDRDGIGVRAVIGEQLAERLGGSEPLGLAVGDQLTRSQEAALRRTLERADDGVGVRVERGYEDSADRTVLLILASVAGLVVLGGTLAATSLALTEARPDLSTLGQVGARPSTRRAVAGGYALVLGLVGAGLGTLAGAVPGVAAAVSLTSSTYGSGTYGGSGWVAYGAGSGDEPRFYLDVPWLLLLLVLVVLPLVSAAVAAASTRSRLDGPTRALA